MPDGIAAVETAAALVLLLVDDPALEHYTPDAWQQALAHVIRERQPSLVLVGNTGMGMDLPVVQPIFESYAKARGVDSRLRFVVGDFFKEPLPQADVIIMGHILHDWNLDEKMMLLRKAHTALLPKGALIVHEALIDDARTNNAFGLLMIAKPPVPGALHLAWPFIRRFTERVFAEDRMAVEAEQRAWDEQGEDRNQEVFPLILDVRDVLRANGVPIRPPEVFGIDFGDSKTRMYFLLVVVFALCAIAFDRYSSFRLFGYDLGNMVQAVWSTAHGHPLRMTNLHGEQISRLAAHIDPILVLFAPLWWIWPSPNLLLVVQAIAIALVMSTVIAAVGAPFAPELLKLMGGSPWVIEHGAAFTRIMLAGNATVVMLFMINAIFRGAGDAAIAMRTLWLANWINILLGPCLIFGLGPFPKLGIAGAAIATNIGRGTGALFALSKLIRKGGRFNIERRHLRIEPEIIGRLLRLSSTATFQVFIGMASWIGLVRIISSFGSNAVAGYTFGIRVILFALLPSWGMSNAAATMVGQALGARDPERAERAVWKAGFYNMIFLGAVGCGFIVFAEPVIRLFTADPEVVAIGARCLRYVSYGYIFYAWGMVLVQAFNGAFKGQKNSLSGTFTVDGQVGPIGGIRQKLAAATQRDGTEDPATVFLVPRGNLAEARGASLARELLLVPIDDPDGALDALADLRDGREPAEAFALPAED